MMILGPQPSYADRISEDSAVSSAAFLGLEPAPALSERRHRRLARHLNDSVRTFLRNADKSRFFIHLRY